MFAQQGLLKLGAHSLGINWLYVQSAEAAYAHDAHSLGKWAVCSPLLVLMLRTLVTRQRLLMLMMRTSWVLTGSMFTRQGC